MNDTVRDPRSTQRPQTPWGWLLAFGLLAVILGILLLATPFLTAVAATAFTGLALLILGIAGVVMGLRAVRASRRWADLVLGILAILVGLYAWLYPVPGSFSLTLAIGIWLAVRGIVEIVTIWRVREDQARLLLLVSGVLDLVIAGLLLFTPPALAVSLLGVGVAAAFIAGGVSLVIAALGLRRLGTPAVSP